MKEVSFEDHIDILSLARLTRARGPHRWFPFIQLEAGHIAGSSEERR